MSKAARPLRLVVYDETDVGKVIIPRIERGSDGTARGTGGLTRWWRLGAAMHRGALRADATAGASSWGQALDWATSIARARGAEIGELQAWGHGGWGYMGLGKEHLDREALARSSSRAGVIDAFAGALSDDALVWLRCCSVFGGEAGRAFAPALAERLRARVAGHTFIIGVWQSGTHSLARGAAPDWSADEGIERRANGVACARESTGDAPRTIGFLRLGLPDGW